MPIFILVQNLLKVIAPYKKKRVSMAKLKHINLIPNNYTMFGVQ